MNVFKRFVWRIQNILVVTFVVVSCFFLEPVMSTGDGEDKDQKNFTTRTPLVPPEQRIDEWLRDEVFPPSAAEGGNPLLWAAFDGYSAIGRGGVFFMLGKNLAERALHDWNSPLKTPLTFLYAMGCFTPPAFVGTKLTREALKGLSARPLSVRHLEDTPIYGLQALGITTMAVSALSSPPAVYLAYVQFDPVLHKGWPVVAFATFYVRTLVDYAAMLRLGRVILHEGREHIYRMPSYHLSEKETLWKVLYERIGVAKNTIKAASHSQAQQMAQRLNEVSETRERLQKLFHPQSLIETSVSPHEPPSVLRKVTGCVGALIGAYGSWLRYPVALKAFREPLDAMGMSVSENAVMSFSAASILAASALTLYTSGNTTLKFYDATTHTVSSFLTHIWPSRFPKKQAPEEEEDITRYRLRIAAACAAAVCAACSGSVQTEVAFEFMNMEQEESYFRLAASAFSFASAGFWGVDEWLLSKLKLSDPRTPGLTLLDIVERRLDNMSLNDLRVLEEITRDQKTDLGSHP